MTGSEQEPSDATRRDHRRQHSLWAAGRRRNRGKPYILPAALLILFALFAAQTRGVDRIGHVFGPVMLIWFLTIGVLGLAGVVRHPDVLSALNPQHAIGFLAQHSLRSFVVLGGVFLAITGGEALYADMGNVGRRPIRAAWYCVVLPALLLSYGCSVVAS